jgi:predicted nucleotidyltransferase component of viral defense system
MSKYADHLILKGALLIMIWNAPASRPTRDIDFLAHLDDDVDAIKSVVQAICIQATEPDGLEFDIKTITGEVIKESDEYPGVRVKFQGHLGEARIHMQLDFGFGDVIIPGATRITYPTLLEMPAPRLLSYTRESVIAEKLESIARLELINSRIKDFYDIWLLAMEDFFEGKILQRAVTETFKHRNRELSTDVLEIVDEYSRTERATARWAILRRKSRLEDAPINFKEIAEVIKGFLGPVIHAVEEGSPAPGKWDPGGPWYD